MNATRRSLNWSTVTAGALIGGLLCESIGLAPTLLVGALGPLLSSLWLVFSPVRDFQDVPLYHRGVPLYEEDSDTRRSDPYLDQDHDRLWSGVYVYFAAVSPNRPSLTGDSASREWLEVSGSADTSDAAGDGAPFG